jgi:hypothetical protein
MLKRAVRPRNVALALLVSAALLAQAADATKQTRHQRALAGLPTGTLTTPEPPPTTPPPTTPPPPEELPENPCDLPLPFDALQLVGLTSTAFNPQTVTARFQLQEATFQPGRSDFRLSINNVSTSIDPAAVSANEVVTTLMLNDGSNDIEFAGFDSFQRPVSFKKRYWAGTNALTVQAVDGANAPVLGAVDVAVKLSDDQDVSSSLSTTTGSATFQNIPSRTVLITARTAANLAGTAGELGSAGTISVPMFSFSLASTIANNDLSQGLAGWVVNNLTASIVPHQEGFSSPAVAASSNNDVRLVTSGQGPQFLSRTFQTDVQTTKVTVRYRFITSEVPGGYFGSTYNDYFSVMVRSSSTGSIINEYNSMNGLGLGAFDGSGATSWREQTLPVNNGGDSVAVVANGGETVQVDVSVANVADAVLDSQVIVDFIEERKDKVTPKLSWDAVDGGLRLDYTVKSELQAPVTITVSWAKGSTYADRIASFFTYDVPAGTPIGKGKPQYISGTSLYNPPSGTTHVVASVSETNFVAVRDVQVSPLVTESFAINIKMVEIIKYGFRAAGMKEGLISRASATPKSQAKAMFDNLVGGGTLKYGPGGTAVIGRYRELTKDMTTAEILAAATEIKAAMEDKIIELGGCQKVTRHCADPLSLSVVDVGKSQFKPFKNGIVLYMAATKPLLDCLVDEEPQCNVPCLHHQLALLQGVDGTCSFCQPK